MEGVGVSERTEQLRDLWLALFEIGAEPDKSDDHYAGWSDCWDKVLGVMEAQPNGAEAREAAFVVFAASGDDE